MAATNNPISINQFKQPYSQVSQTTSSTAATNKLIHSSQKNNPIYCSHKQTNSSIAAKNNPIYVQPQTNSCKSAQNNSIYCSHKKLIHSSQKQPHLLESQTTLSTAATNKFIYSSHKLAHP
jgi:hypothetical protein